MITLGCLHFYPLLTYLNAGTYAWRLLMMMALTLSSFHAFEMEIAGYTSKKNLRWTCI